jgi:predicted alpha/beta-fold hydrolase
MATSFFPAPRQPWNRWERLELDDGDFLDLAWLERSSAGRLAILSHGLEGSLEASYVRSMAGRLHACGWDVLAWNYRSCGGVPNRLPRTYHSGASDDLRAVVNHAAPGYAHVALVGFSLGGNLSLKYAAEAPPPPPLSAVVAISAPVDLASSAHAIDTDPLNRLYLRRFLRTLLPKAWDKARRFPGWCRRGDLQRIRTIRDFDELVTAPLNGFASAEDYWARSSALPLLPRLTVPALLLNARNDPMLAPESFPESVARQHAHFHLESPEHGGHVGFPGSGGNLTRWADQRTAEFLADAMGAPEK